MSLSAQNGETDRIIFPNYLDFIYLLTLPQNEEMNVDFQLSNTFDYPFQIGMAYAVNPENITKTEKDFLSCLRSILSALDLQVI